MNKIKVRRLEYIDITRAFAIIAIIASHTGYLPLSRYISPFISAWMIPVFAISGGFVFKLNSGIIDFIFKKFKRLIIPFVIFFSLSFIGWLILQEGYSKPMLSLSFDDIWIGFLTGQGLIFNGPLWFLPSYFLALTFAGAIYPLWMKSGISVKLIFLFITVLIFIALVRPGIKPFFSYDLSVLLLFYIYLGHLFSDLRINFRLSSVLFFILFLTLFAGLTINGAVDLNYRNLNYPPLFIMNSVLGSLLIFSIARYLDKFKIKLKVLQKIGRYSLILMAVHWPIMQWMTYLISLTGVINYSNTYPTSTNFFIPSAGPSLGLSIIRISLFSLYLLVPIITTLFFINLGIRLQNKRD